MRRAQYSRSRARTVEGTALARVRIKLQGRATTSAARRSKAMGGVNAAVEVGKHELHVALGSAGELLSERNEPRAVKRLAKRLAEEDCARVLIEGELVSELAGRSTACSATAGGDHQSAPGARVRQEHRATGQDRS